MSGVLDVLDGKKRREACMNPRFRNGGKNLLCTLTGDPGGGEERNERVCWKRQVVGRVRGGKTGEKGEKGGKGRRGGENERRRE